MKQTVEQFLTEREHFKLYDHQKEAIKRYALQDEIPLFFEMGCGKTATTLLIAEYKFINNLIDCLLVIAPNDVHYQWYKDEIPKWLTIKYQSQCFGGRGGFRELKKFVNTDDKELHIVCVNVDTFSTPSKWKPLVEWANTNKTMLVIDEATSIKNVSSKRSQRLLYEFNNVLRRGKTIVSSKKINPVRCVLTGTPVTNGPMDLWSIMEFVRPNYFNRNWYAFRNYYGMFTKLTVPTPSGYGREVPVLLNEKTWAGIKRCSSYEQAGITFGCSPDTYLTVMHQDKFMGPYKHALELRNLLEKTATFKKLVDCVDMPEQQFIVRNVPMSDEQRECYKSMVANLISSYGGYEMTAKNKMVSYIRLQQISSGFIFGSQSVESFFEDLDESNLEDKDVEPNQVVWLGDSNPKLDALMRDIDELDKPLLVITKYSAEAAKIYDMLKDKYSTCLITGWKREGSIDGFKQGEYDIMVANNAVIARGHNLQNAHVTLFYSNSFDMELRQQAEFRTFRIGQSNRCIYIDYICSPVEETIYKSLKMKLGLLEFIRNKDTKNIFDDIKC